MKWKDNSIDTKSKTKLNTMQSPSGEFRQRFGRSYSVVIVAFRDQMK